MNIDDMIRAAQGQQNQSVLSRQPTIGELDKFIDRVLDEKDETPYTMFQSIKFKLEKQPHSIVEAEIYPHVLNRIAERFGGKS